MDSVPGETEEEGRGGGGEGKRCGHTAHMVATYIYTVHVHVQCTYIRVQVYMHVHVHLLEVTKQQTCMKHSNCGLHEPIQCVSHLHFTCTCAAHE